MPSSSHHELLLANGGSAPAPAITWNPLDKHADIVLSNGNLTAMRTGSNAHRSVRATQGYNTGKYYFEVAVTGAIDPVYIFIGIGTAAAEISNYAGWADAESTGFYAFNGHVYFTASFNAYGVTYTAGDVIGVAVNTLTAAGWVAKNNVWVNTPDSDPVAQTATTLSLTDTTALIYPMASMFHGDGPAALTIRSTLAAFSYTPPAGYTAWAG